MKNNIALLDELKHLYNIKTNVELGERFNIPVKTIETWVFKNEIPLRGQSVEYIKLLIDIAKRENRLNDKINEMKKLMLSQVKD